jgi:hypothetical protein
MPLPPRLASACAANPATLAANISAFERPLAHNREAKIVWQHLSWDNTGQLTLVLVRRLLAAYGNLDLTLRAPVLPPGASGGRTPPNRITDMDGGIRSEWLDLMRDLPDRFIIGADDFIVSRAARQGGPSSSMQPGACSRSFRRTSATASALRTPPGITVSIDRATQRVTMPTGRQLGGRQ